MYKGRGVVKVLLAQDVPGNNFITSNNTGKRNWNKVITEDGAWRDNDGKVDTEKGSFHNNDTVLADTEVIYFGQPIALVVATTESVARRVAKELELEVEYSNEPIEIDLNKCISEKKFMISPSGDPLSQVFRPHDRTSKEINWDKHTKNGCEIIEGNVKTGGQYHFYMETQSAIAIPQGDNLTVIASAQGPGPISSKVQAACSSATQPLSSSQISVVIGMVGGGFGGKEPQAVFTAAAASVAARVLNRPVRLVLDRRTDMEMIGKRHAFYGEYKLAVDPTTKKVCAMNLNIYTDGGSTYDCSFSVLELALLCSENAYLIEDSTVFGKVVRTNKASSTAMRSFGVIQTNLILETAFEHAAHTLKCTPETIREASFYKNNDVTPYGTVLKDCLVSDVWKSLLESSEFTNRKKDVAQFNAENRWKKKGICVLPLQYGISFVSAPMNQAGALINVYKDGSVRIAHCGAEIGQGIYTKALQIASYALRIPMKYLTHAPSDSAVIPNSSNTGASTGTDLNGGAVELACKTIRERLEKMISDIPASELEKIKDKLPPGKEKTWVDIYRKNEGWFVRAQGNAEPNPENDIWASVVSYAYSKGINLSCQEWFYKGGNIKAPKNDASNYPATPFYYYNYAAACSEVEIDVITGEFNLIRTDIVYDAGLSVNPAIDIGQCEGGFVQGLGFLTTEHLEFDENGFLETNNTWEYKPPCHRTIPHSFKVDLFMDNKINHTVQENKNMINPVTIQSSKTAGEPPLVLANTVYFAIRSAIQEARRELFDIDGFVAPPAPLTTQNIQDYCAADKEPGEWLKSFSFEEKKIKDEKIKDEKIISPPVASPEEKDSKSLKRKHSPPDSPKRKK